MEVGAVKTASRIQKGQGKIERDIQVLRNLSGFDRISYVQGTNAIPIIFHIKDYDIPPGSAARVYVKRPDGTIEYDLAEIGGNDVTVNVKSSMFSVTGNSLMQIKIIKEESVLVTFGITVCVERNYIDDTFKSENSTDIFDGMVEEVKTYMEDTKKNAADSAVASENCSKLSESWARGETGLRSGENENNSKFFAQLAESLTNEAQKLLDQAQKIISAAASVYGVKGSSETEYRTGLVNITPDDIGIQGIGKTLKEYPLIGAGADMDDYKAPGNYCVHSSNLDSLRNKPPIPDNTAACIFRVEEGYTSGLLASKPAVRQRFQQFLRPYIWERCLYNESWTDWELVQTSEPLNMQSGWSLSGGTEIAENADLNASEYLEIGNYYCPTTSAAETLFNCPIENAFTMKVELSADISIVRQTIRPYNTGDVYVRILSNDGSGLIFDWMLIAADQSKKLDASRIVENTEITEPGFLMDGKTASEALKGLKGVLIWSNPDPSVAFAPQNITLNNEYNRYKIYYRPTITSSRLQVAECAFGCGTFLNYSGTQTSGAPYVVSRSVTLNPNILGFGIGIFQSVSNASYIENNNRCVPAFIVGCPN